VFDEGLVLVLLELHDRLDAARRMPMAGLSIFLTMNIIAVLSC